MQWQNSALAAQRRVLKKTPGMGDAATWLLDILLARARRCGAQKLQLCVCLFPHRFKEIKNTLNKSPQTKKPHMNLALHSVCRWYLPL